MTSVASPVSISSQSTILEGLNDRQLQAATALTGSTLVIAGAGSGKTSVLTRRVAQLISNGVAPGSILCVTFTNKAAAEMNSRVRTLLQENGINLPFTPVWKADYTQSPLLSTFHSLGVRILREFGEEIGIRPEFNILDTDDQKKTIRRILKELNVDAKTLQPKVALYFISQCKQEMLTARESRKVSREYLPIFHQIYKKYEEELRSSHVVDFDDLLLLSYQLLSENELVRSTLHNRWKHVMVDEFQDTNQIQFEIIRLLMPPGRLKIGSDSPLVSASNTPDGFAASPLKGVQALPPDFDPVFSTSLFVVGDDAQSIYAFRGSKIDIILNFGQEYPGSGEIVLNQNYRSTQPILDLAEMILTHNPRQKKKQLFTDNPEKIDVHYYLARNEKDEAEFMVRTLYRLYAEGGSSAAKTPLNPSQEGTGDSDPASRLKIPDFAASNSAADVILDTQDSTLNESVTEPELQLDTDPESNDPIAMMFDVHLESDEMSPQNIGMNSAQLGQSMGRAHSYQGQDVWQISQYNFGNISQLNDVVVLYRTHSQSRAIEEMFLKYHVPYRLVSGTRFLDRREIKDVLAMLKYLSNGDDKVSLSRFLPLVLDGVGPKTLQKIMAYLEDFDYPLPPRHAQNVLDLFSKMQSVWLNHDNLINLTKELITVSGYTRWLKQEYPSKEDFQARMENIGELYSLMFAFDQDKTVELPQRLSAFLEHVGLMTQQEANEGDTQKPKVNLMSLHQSKGLEFETVFLVGCEDGILPHQNSFLEEKGMEEEVRLAYVGVTRAKKHLYLISADSRVQFGQIKANPTSRIIRPFLDSAVKRVGRG